MTQEPKFLNGFAIGFFTCATLFLIVAVLSACVGGRPFSDKEKQLYSVQVQISRLTAQENALKKAIREEKENSSK